MVVPGKLKKLDNTYRRYLKLISVQAQFLRRTLFMSQREITYDEFNLEHF